MGRSQSTSHDSETALLIGVQHRESNWEVQDCLAELAQLTETAGARIAGQIIVRQSKPNSGTYIGKGKAEEIASQVKEQKISTVVFDDELTPAQGRNLEKIMETKVIDRTQLILDIFAQHARTREGSLQIQLAQLQYMLPRLRHRWSHLERQKGGIGLRGPGEQQIELDRRQVQNQIALIRRELEDVKSRRSEQRRGRRRHGWALVTLVGYTNAGKSTLLNSLTGAEVEAVDQLFATLDPTTRQLRLPNHQSALVTDTVGFIRKLPHHLVNSFRATLEEVTEADLLIHVVDSSHPMVDQQIEAVEGVLKELGCGAKPVLAALNKIDRDEAQGQWPRLAARFKRAVAVSALKGDGLERLKEELADAIRERYVTLKMRIPQSAGDLLAALHRAATVRSLQYDGNDVLIEARVPSILVGRCMEYVTGESADGDARDER